MSGHNTGSRGLNDILQCLAQEQPGDFSWIVAPLAEEGQSYVPIASYQENRIHQSASMIKVAIMECVFHEAKEGRIDLEERIMLSTMPRVEGGGALQELVGRHAFTLLELCRLMMVLSDNWATNLLCKRLGFAMINQRIQEIGLQNTRLERVMMDTQAAAKGQENWTTAHDLAMLFARLYEQREEYLWGNEMWRILGRQQFRDKIPFYWGLETPFFHKTGCLDRVEHDGGVYSSMEGDFIIVILASHLQSNEEGIARIARMGREIRTYIQERYVRR